MDKLNAVLKELGNMINSLINKQEMKYYIKRLLNMNYLQMFKFVIQ